MSSTYRRFATALLSVVMAVVSTLSFGTAFALELSAGSLPVSLIDGSAKAELRIHKSAGDPFTAYGDPTNPQSRTSREPLSGITFRIQKIDGIDLTKNEGWEAAEQLQTSDFFQGGKEAGRLGPVQTATTNTDGWATFQNLEVGLYFVTEDPDSAVAQNLTVIAPFVITLPSVNEAGTEWVYNRSVQAKDQPILANKMVDQTCADLGQLLEYGISATLPAPIHTAIESFSISDPLVKETEFVEGTSEVFVGDQRGAVKTEKLHPTDFLVEKAGNTVTMKLTDTGLSKAAKLREGNPDVMVTWKFQAKVTAPVHQIRNRAYVTPPGYPTFNEIDRPGVPTNETIVRTPCPTPSNPTVPIPVPVPTPTPATTTPPAENEDKRPNLPDTGANVYTLVGFSLLAIAIGSYFIQRNKKESEDR